MKREDREKIFAKHMSDKESVSRIYKLSNSLKKQLKDLTRYFIREDVQMANKSMERFSDSRVINKVQPKPQ